MDHMWTCRCCGQQFTELPLSVGFDVPDPWHGLSDAERESRGLIGSDICTIDEHYFLRGCLDVPIVDRMATIFSWSVWVSISAQSFEHIKNVWDEDVRDGGPALFGWLCNSIPDYPETYALRTHIHLRNHGIRPYIELEPTDHPLATEQREGITMRRVEEIVAASLMH